MFGVNTGVLREEEQVVGRASERQGFQTEAHALEHLVVEGVAQLHVLQTDEVARLHVAVAGQSVIGNAGVGVHGTRDFGEVTVLAPAPVHGATLVVVGAHVFSIHTGHVNNLGTGTDLANKGNPLIQGAPFGTFMITDARVSYIRFNDLSNSLDTKYMLVEGVYTAETMPPYEPYYEPVTTNLYLPEPIKMVGDEAEYIDYAEQQFHRISDSDLDVTLPALPVLPGTNTLTVGTEVQPSGVEMYSRQALK